MTTETDRCCTAAAWSPAAWRPTASPSCSRSPAATCSRSTTAAARRASTSSTSATSRPRRSPPRAGRRSRASPASCALTAGPGRDQRHERDRLGAAEPLADARARRPRARVALGPGLAAGDRPRAVRAAAHALRRDGRLDRRRSRASSTRRWPPRCARTPGPAFVDFPLDHVFMEARRGDAARPSRRRAPAPPAPDLARALALLADAERPVIMAGTNLYWGRGEGALRELVEARGIPVFLNGLARGCVPADHELVLRARAQDRAQGRRRRARRRRADGLPARLRQVVRRGDARSSRSTSPSPSATTRAPVAAELYGDLAAILVRARRGPRRRTRAAGSRRSARDRDARSARPSASCARTRARRCTRCASTPSSARCSTATRS